MTRKISSHDTSPESVKNAQITAAQYSQLYERSITDPKHFWAEQAHRFVSWITPWDSVLKGDFHNINIRWFEGAKLNVSYNCIDRHLPERAHQTAIIWEGDSPCDSRKISYQELYEAVCQFANVLKTMGVVKGDRVCIYMPMIPEAAFAMLACARLGAIHSVVFAGFSAESLKNRILDANCSIVITADEGRRGGKVISLKKNVDQALQHCPDVKNVLVVKHTGNIIDWTLNRDHWYHECVLNVEKICEPVAIDANDPLFILYTSGSTGKPKGVVHVAGGYLVYVATTFKYIFDYHDNDIYWCSADIGWITGHSYLIYGPLANGATTLMFEGVPNYPTPARFWEMIDRHQVNIFYTAPTAIRALRREGDQFVTSPSRKSLKLLGTVGEPINPDVWEWYFSVVGNKRCAIVDTWWQTETGGALLSPLPGVTKNKPGSVAGPFLGIVPAIVDDQGNILSGAQTGKLVISKPWPGLMKTIYGNHQRFIDGYFKSFPGYYQTSDEAYRDEDGYYWIRGRTDDVINVSGHRLSTAEIENVLLQHPAVSEAAVVGMQHEIKGQAVYAYVTLKAQVTPDSRLKEALFQLVRDEIGAIATPQTIQWTSALPKTRSGKIMRRLLRKIADGNISDFGDISTLADPAVIDEIINDRLKEK